MEEYFPFESVEFHDPLSNFEPAEYGSELEWALAEESVVEIASKPFLEISPTASILQAVQTMSGSGSACLIVVDDGKIVGIVTERDMLEKVAEQYSKLASHPVSEVMTVNPTVVYESDPAAAAIAAIAVAGHRHVPVLGMDDRVIGVIDPVSVFKFIESHCIA